MRLPLLQGLFDEQSRPARPNWLDLGPLQSGLLCRLEAARARLIIADLASARHEARAQWYLPERLLPGQFWDRPFDCVLLWDLPDYMQSSELQALGSWLAGRLKPEARMHMLVHYARPEMPAEPAFWRLNPQGEARPEFSCIESATAPRYSPKALQKLMPQMNVEQTVLLNNGMQEYTLTLRREG